MQSSLAMRTDDILDGADGTPEEVLSIVETARHAADGFLGALASDDKLLAALALGRIDWLEGLGYTKEDALRRIGPHHASLLPEAAKVLRAEGLV